MIECYIIVLRVRLCNIIVLSVHALSEKKHFVTKYSFYEQLDLLFEHFPRYHLKILLGHFNAKFWRKNIFKPTIRNLHKYSIDNGVIRVNFATTKFWLLKSTMFRTETFIRIPGPLLMGRLTARQKHIVTQELAFEDTRFTTFQGS